MPLSEVEQIRYWHQTTATFWGPEGSEQGRRDVAAEAFRAWWSHVDSLLKALDEESVAPTCYGVDSEPHQPRSCTMPNTIELESGSIVRGDQVITIKVDEGRTAVSVYLQTSDGKTHFVEDFRYRFYRDKFPALDGTSEGMVPLPKSRKKALKKAMRLREDLYVSLGWNTGPDA